MTQAEPNVLSHVNWQVLEIGVEWNNQFRIFKRSAFRLEVLQAYAEPSEAAALETFLSGKELTENYTAEWCALVRDHIDQGRTMTRVHLVDLPLSDYMRFEVECAYAHTSKAGENIFLLERKKVTAEMEPLVKEDFWFFDDSKVMVQDYNPQGTLFRARISDDPEVVSYYRRVRDLVLPQAEPFRVVYKREVGKEV